MHFFRSQHVTSAQFCSGRKQMKCSRQQQNYQDEQRCRVQQSRQVGRRDRKTDNRQKASDLNDLARNSPGDSMFAKFCPSPYGNCRFDKQLACSWSGRAGGAYECGDGDVDWGGEGSGGRHSKGSVTATMTTRRLRTESHGKGKGRLPRSHCIFSSRALSDSHIILQALYQASHCTIALIYLQYGIYDSPAPASFIRKVFPLCPTLWDPLRRGCRYYRMTSTISGAAVNSHIRNRGGGNGDRS
jgi:hypothetical protein